MIACRQWSIALIPKFANSTGSVRQQSHRRVGLYGVVELSMPCAFASPRIDPIPAIELTH
jgi:hypothetical protein